MSSSLPNELVASTAAVTVSDTNNNSNASSSSSSTSSLSTSSSLPSSSASPAIDAPISTILSEVRFSAPCLQKVRITPQTTSIDVMPSPDFDALYAAEEATADAATDSHPPQQQSTHPPQQQSKPRYPSLLHYACAVLNAADDMEKAMLTFEADYWVRKGKLDVFVDEQNGDGSSNSSSSSSNTTPSPSSSSFPSPPLRPSRPRRLHCLPANLMPKAMKGVDNHAYNKVRLIHSLCHIELNAIDLAWDILARFATPPRRGSGGEGGDSGGSSSFGGGSDSSSSRNDDNTGSGIESTLNVVLPFAFYSDWLRIAVEEARHFLIWRTRLTEMSSSYGCLPVHDALWQSAFDSNDSLLARLAIVHCVHEARGLDQSPRMISQLETFGDAQSSKLLSIIERDELTHVSSGLRWFRFICDNACPPLPAVATFHSIVRQRFRGSLLPPFNTEARKMCGFTEEWYLPLATKKDAVKATSSAAVAPAKAMATEQPVISSTASSSDAKGDDWPAPATVNADAIIAPTIAAVVTA